MLRKLRIAGYRNMLNFLFNFYFFPTTRRRDPLHNLSLIRPGHESRQLIVGWMGVVQTAKIGSKTKTDVFMVNFVVEEGKYENEW